MPKYERKEFILQSFAPFERILQHLALGSNKERLQSIPNIPMLISNSPSFDFSKQMKDEMETASQAISSPFNAQTMPKIPQTNLKKDIEGFLGCIGAALHGLPDISDIHSLIKGFIETLNLHLQEKSQDTDNHYKIFIRAFQNGKAQISEKWQEKQSAAKILMRLHDEKSRMEKKRSPDEPDADSSDISCPRRKQRYPTSPVTQRRILRNHKQSLRESPQAFCEIRYLDY